MNKNRGKSINRLLKTTCLHSLALSVCIFGSATPALAAPQDGDVTAGNATINYGSIETTINQTSDRAVINWRSFDIAPSETVRFQQPSAQSITVNRVRSDQASLINGNINANGNVVVINPNGVLIGNQANIDVNGLIATTTDIDDQRFMSGELKFDRPGRPDAQVINEGTITAAQAGLVGLVAPHAENKGIISARLGRVEIAGAEKFTVDLGGDGLIRLDVSENANILSAINSGSIDAAGGHIGISAADARSLVNSLVENRGTLSADSVGQNKGTVVLQAAASASSNNVVARNSGRINARGLNNQEAGGNVDIVAEQVVATASSRIDVSGSKGGGRVRLGGDYQGSGDIQRSRSTVLEAGSTINADALYNGNGGTVIAWSDGGTWSYGSITARGGATSGNGGLVETSGHYLDARGLVTTSAFNGLHGTYLLDPTDLYITNDPEQNITPGNPYAPNADDAASNINASTLLSWLYSNNITVMTRAGGTQAGNIYINADLGYYDDEQSYGLTFIAANDIFINNTLLFGGYGDITFNAGRDVVANNIFNSDNTVSYFAGRDAVINSTQYAGSMDFRVGRDLVLNDELVGSVYLGSITPDRDVSIGSSLHTLNLTQAELAKLRHNGLYLTQNIGHAVIHDTTIGHLTVFTSAAGSIDFTGSSNITNLDLRTNDLYITGALANTSAGSLVLSAVDVSDSIGIGSGAGGTLNISDAVANKLFNNRTINYGYIGQYNSIGDIRIDRAINWGNSLLNLTGNNVEINADQSGVSSLSINAADLNLNSNITGTSQGSLSLTLYNTTTGQSFGLGDSATGTFHISDAELTRLGNQWNNIWLQTRDTSANFIDVNIDTLLNYKNITLYNSGGNVNIFGNVSLTTGSDFISYASAFNLSGTLAGDGLLKFYPGSGIGIGTGAIGAFNISDVEMANLGTSWDFELTSSGLLDWTYDANLNGDIDLYATAITISGDIDVADNNIYMRSDTLDLTGSLSGTGDLEIYAFGTMGLAGAAGTFNLTVAELDKIQNGWSQLDFRSSLGQTHAAYTWRDAVDFRSDSSTISVTGNQNFQSNNASYTANGLVNLTGELIGTGQLQLGKYTAGGAITVGTTGTGMRLTAANITSYIIGNGWSGYTFGNRNHTGLFSLTGTTTWDADLSLITRASAPAIVGINVGSNDLNIEVDGNLNIANQLTGTGVLTIKPINNNRNIGLGNASGAGQIQLTALELSRISNGWSRIVFGDSSLNTNIYTGTTTWNDPVSFLTGSGFVQVASITSADTSADINKFIISADRLYIPSAGNIDPGSGRMLVYTATPLDDNYGDTLTRPTKRYNRTYASHAPDTITEIGNVFNYANTPVVEVAVNNATREYGAANPGFGFTVISGLIDGDLATDAVTSANYTTSANLLSGVGSYSLSAALLSDMGYSFVMSPGVLSVTAAPLIVNAGNASRYLGQSSFTLPYSLAGLRNSDGYEVVDATSFTTLAQLNSAAGDYTAYAYPQLTGGNYYIAGNNPGLLTVLPQLAADLIPTGLVRELTNPNTSPQSDTNSTDSNIVLSKDSSNTTNFNLIRFYEDETDEKLTEQN